MLRAAAAGVLAGLLLLPCLSCVGPDPYGAEVERGGIALGLGSPEDAADAYRAALTWRRDGPEALHGLARCYVAQGDGEAALELFAQLERSAPDYLREEAATDYHFALYQAAKARLYRGDAAAALRLARRLRALDPGHGGLEELLVEALLAEGGRLQVAGHPEEAQALFRESLGGDDVGPDPYRALAERLLETGQLDTAISVLSDALERHPRDPRLEALMDRALDLRYPDGLFRGNGPAQGKAR